MAFASIPDAANDIREGRMIIVVDDEDRENEGDLVCAAERVTPEIINFMARHARGLICLPLTEERCDELNLPPQVADNTSHLGTAFTMEQEFYKGRLQSKFDLDVLVPEPNDRRVIHDVIYRSRP